MRRQRRNPGMDAALSACILASCPMKVADDKLRSFLGIASINFQQSKERLAIIDTPLQG
jgi:hypothetical protein